MRIIIGLCSILRKYYLVELILEQVSLNRFSFLKRYCKYNLYFSMKYTSKMFPYIA